MTSFGTKNNSLWSYKILEKKREPFEEKLLKNCSWSEIQAKIEFLEKNVSLIKTECEALEMFVVKIHPKFLEEKDIDVSWMPYEFKTEKHKFATIVPKVIKTSKTIKNNSMTSRSVFTVVQRAMTVKKISLHHLLNIIGQQVKYLSIDFDKYFGEMFKKCRKMDNETENYEVEYQRTLGHVENYKLEIIEAAHNRITKSIPASKYRLFIKKRLMKNTIMITEIQIKTSNLMKKYNTLKMKILKLKSLLSNLTETDVWLHMMVHKKLKRQFLEQSKIEKLVLANKKNIYQDYKSKTRKMEKYKEDINLPSLDRQIQLLRDKIKILQSIQKLTDDNDDEQFQNVVISDDLITQYIEVKHYIVQSNKEIKCLKERLHRQHLTKQLYYKSLKKTYEFKQFDENQCTSENISIKENKSQNQLSMTRDYSEKI